MTGWDSSTIQLPFQTIQLALGWLNDTASSCDGAIVNKQLIDWIAQFHPLFYNTDLPLTECKSQLTSNWLNGAVLT